MAETSIIEELSARFSNVASSARFEIELQFPTVVGQFEDAKYLLKASTIPPEAIGEIPVAYKGQKFSLPGDREWEPLSCTAYSTEDWALRNQLEKWMKITNDPETGLKSPYAEITGNVIINQLGAGSLEPVARYKLMDAWIPTLGEITLDWESENEIQIFDFTIKYQRSIRI